MFLAGALVAGAGSLAVAQSASTIGAGGVARPAASATGGTGGSAAAGGTSASTLGARRRPAAARPRSAPAAAPPAARATASSTKLHGNANTMNGMSKARAQDKGTWSNSKTHTKIHKGEVSSRTKTMAHEPGGPPVKSTTGINTGK